MKTTILILLLALEALAGVKIHHSRSTGKEYYIVFPKAAWGNQNVGVLLSSPTAQTITITQSSTSHDTIEISQPRTTRYVGGLFPIVNVPESTYKAAATHIQSPDGIAVTAQYGLRGISGTYTALPVSSWGREYYFVAPPEGTNVGYYYYPTIYSVPMITIIGSHAGTSVLITPKVNTSRGHLKDIPFTITLNAGDVYNITTQGDPQATDRIEDACQNDLTGTHIVSNYPVGVIASQSHTSWPCGHNNCGDYCVEWLPPVANLDSVYLAGPYGSVRYDVMGQTFEIVCVHDSTTIMADEGVVPPVNLGMHSAGEAFEYRGSNILPTNTSLITGNHPFMIVEYTLSPDCMYPSGTTNGNLNFSMDVLDGVHQWSDYSPFSTPPDAYQTAASIYFHKADGFNLSLNGMRLAEFANMQTLVSGFAKVSVMLAPGSYYEITGDSGATAGGMVFGEGVTRYAPGGERDTAHVQSPEAAKAFAHPIGGNFAPINDSDATRPHDSVYYDCTNWRIWGYDDELDPPASGICDIWLAESAPPDSSFNVRFNPAPKFTPGDTKSSNFTISVINFGKPARAVLHYRDCAGNEYDTIFTYIPQPLAAGPEELDGGSVGRGDSITKCFTLSNGSAYPEIVSKTRLNNGAHWRLVSDSASFTIPASGSHQVCVRYVADTGTKYHCDVDTLLLTTCSPYPAATMSACNVRPAIAAYGYDFGAHYFNAPETTYAAVHVVNVGTDILHVNGTTLFDTAKPPSFQITSVLPTPDAPWVLMPGDTHQLTVLCQPRHEGIRKAHIYFASDAQHVSNDTAWLQVVGLLDPTVSVSMTAIPNAPSLAENYPNPFTDATTIAFDAPEGKYVVAIFNGIGEKVGEVKAVRGGDGRYGALWSAVAMPAGIYFYSVNSLMLAGKFIFVR